MVVDVPQVNFQLAPGTGAGGRGLVKAFRYGLVMPGGSRIVFDLTGPAKITNSYVLEAANGQPARLVLELEEVDRAAFVQIARPGEPPRAAADDRRRAAGNGSGRAASAAAKPGAPADGRPVVVIDPGHGGIDNGTQSSGESEKNLVLAFGLALRDRLEKTGKYRVVMTRDDDTFIPLNDRPKVARNLKAALFVSIHADALPKAEGDAQGATIYTLSDKASDAEAAAAGGRRKPRRRDRRLQSRGRADRRRRHPDRPHAAGNPHLFKPFCPSADGRNEVDGADAQASPEVGRLPGAEGA